MPKTLRPKAVTSTVVLRERFWLTPPSANIVGTSHFISMAAVAHHVAVAAAGAVSAKISKDVLSSPSVMAAPRNAWVGLRKEALLKSGSAKSLVPVSQNGNKGQTVCTVATEQVATIDFAALNEELQSASPFQVMDKALELYGDDIAIAFSGAEDVALIEYAKLTGRPFRVFSLDTGRLNAETYQFFDKVEKHYGIHIEYMFPESAAVENLVRTKGLFSFYEDGHNECCGIRKVQPLKRALKGLKAWITGVRKDQSPGTRAQVPVAQIDPAFEGQDGGKGSLAKFNPLANVSSLEVWDFLRTMEVPVNELHVKGFTSIGCEPCTKGVLPNQHEREGRWWWEDATAKECGLHKAEPKEGEASSSGPADVGYSSSVDREGQALRDLFQDSAVATLERSQIEKLAFSAEAREESWLVVLYAPWCPYCQAMEEAFNETAQRLAGTGVRVAKFQADKDQKEWAKANLQLKSFPTLLFFPKNSTSIVKRISERRDTFSLLTWVKALK